MEDKWQPIETAPKGGGAEFVTDQMWVNPPKILVFFENGEMAVVYWDHYYAEGGSGCTDGVAWIDPLSSEQVNLTYGNPTHWQPRPSPPEGET